MSLSRCRAGSLTLLPRELADNRFPKAPRLLNELLNRGKPSSSAVAAQNVLLRRMALHEGEERLSIEGFSTEGGLFRVTSRGHQAVHADTRWMELRLTRPHCKRLL